MTRTTEAPRRAIQASDASVRVRTERFGIRTTTVQLWRHRAGTADRPRTPRSTVLTAEEEARIGTFRQASRLLSLDRCLKALKPTIPHLSRGALHRCLQRHGVSRRTTLRSGQPEGDA